MLVLSTITNGPYWKSSFEPMLYPTGVSFYREFSYRPEWVEDSVYAEIRGQTFKVKKWLRDNSRAFFCVRFLGANSRMLVPIRKAELTWINPGPKIHIYFRLQEFVDYRQIPFPKIIDLTSASISDEKLFFRCPESWFNLPTVNDDDLVWDSIIEKFAAKDQTYPFNNGNAAFFIKLSKVFDQTSELSAKRIGESRVKGPIYGYELAAGDAAELKYVHRLDPSIGHGDFNYAVSCDSPNVEFSRKDIEIQGQYREHVVTMHGSQPVARPFEVSCRPAEKYDAAVFPVVHVNFRLAQRRWKQWLAATFALFLIALALILCYELNIAPQKSPASFTLSLFVTSIIFPIILDLIKKYIRP